MKAAIQFLFLSLLAGLTLNANAQRPEDQTAIQAIVHEEQEAWNQGDAKAFSTHFASDGSFTNIVGMQTYGLAPFQKQHERIFATIYKGSHIEMTPGKVKFLRPDIAVADVDCVLSHTVSLPPGTALDANGALDTKLQLVLSKENGAWRVDAFHNVAVNPAAANPPK